MSLQILSAGFAAGLLLLLACTAEGPSGVQGRPWLRAEISGSVQDGFTGDGWFRRDGDPRSEGAIRFVISSEQITRDHRKSLLLWRNMEGIPTPGTYSVRLPDEASERWADFAATYAEEVGGLHRAYVATDGQVTIKSAGAQRIEGAFHFTAALYCARTNEPPFQDPYPCTPARVDPDAPKIQAEGAFVVEPDTFRLVADPGRS